MTLYLPPTQSQNPKTLCSLIPNLFVSGRFVDTAVKWASRTPFKNINNNTFSSLTPSSLYYSRIQFLQTFAFMIVSAVVNVFELITMTVSSTFNPYSALSVSTGSTFAKNLNYLPFAN